MEYAVWQNLVGAWPVSEERMVAYARKAARETKRHTSWQRSDEAYEQALAGYLSAIYADEELLGEVEALRGDDRRRRLPQLAGPGAPEGPRPGRARRLPGDRAVGLQPRRPGQPASGGLRASSGRLLASLASRSAEELWESRADGAVKLHVLTRLLDLRARHADALGPGGDYRPLEADGRDEARVIAFARGDTVVGVLTRWWQRRGPLRAAGLTLPEGSWTNVLTGSGPWSGHGAGRESPRSLPRRRSRAAAGRRGLRGRPPGDRGAGSSGVSSDPLAVAGASVTCGAVGTLIPSSAPRLSNARTHARLVASPAWSSLRVGVPEQLPVEVLGAGEVHLERKRPRHGRKRDKPFQELDRIGLVVDPTHQPLEGPAEVVGEPLLVEAHALAVGGVDERAHLLQVGRAPPETADGGRRSARTPRSSAARWGGAPRDHR